MSDINENISANFLGMPGLNLAVILISSFDCAMPPLGKIQTNLKINYQHDIPIIWHDLC